MLQTVLMDLRIGIKFTVEWQQTFTINVTHTTL